MTTTVTQTEANSILSTQLERGKQYTFSQIKDVLQAHFQGINANQCSGVIFRAHSKNDGILTKQNKYYSLRATTKATNSGLDEAKQILEEALEKIEQIPVKSFQTAEQFTEFFKLKDQLIQLIK